MTRVIELTDQDTLLAWTERRKAHNRQVREEQEMAQAREDAQWTQAHPMGCVRCHDTGLRRDHTPCDCGLGVTVALRMSETDIRTFLEAAKVPPRQLDRRLETFPAKRLHAFGWIKRWTNNWDGWTGFTLYGPYGTGKTGLMVSALVEIRDHESFRGSPSVRFITSVDLLDALRPHPDNPAFEDTNKTFSRLQRVRLLAIDDLGKDKPTEWVHERLFALINYRYNHRLPTLITTNYGPEDLHERVGEGVVGRLLEMGGLVAMDEGAANLRLRSHQR